MNIDLLIEAAHYIEKNKDHDYCSEDIPETHAPDIISTRLQEKYCMRKYHNELERKRRADLRDNLDMLKKIMPAEEGVKRFSTVKLLSNAASYIKRLQMRYETIDFETQKLGIEIKCIEEELKKHCPGAKRMKLWTEERQYRIQEE